MEKVKIDRESWHFKLTDMLFNDIESVDFCSYWRWFALAMITTLGFVTFMVSLVILLIFAIITSPGYIGAAGLFIAVIFGLAAIIHISLGWITKNFDKWYVKYPVFSLIGVGFIALVTAMIMIPIFAGAVGYLLLMVAGIGLVSVAALVIVAGCAALGTWIGNWYADRVYNGITSNRVAKEPSIFVTRYKSWKEKYCPMVEYVN
jgi:hypothetical protein